MGRTFARGRAAELVARRWIGDQTIPDDDAPMAITRSTRDMIKSVVERAIKENLTLAQLTEALRQSPAFSEARAARIAQYESTAAYHAATLEVFEQSGQVDYVVWRTMADGLVEQTCLANEDAGPVRLGDDFPSGDQGPPQHNFCRCWLEVADQ